MIRKTRRLLLGVAALVATLSWTMAALWGQVGAKNGEWRPMAETSATRTTLRSIRSTRATSAGSRSRGD